jgi:hypothetical protein
MNFSVGQVVYLLTRKDPKVYPALICEEIKKRSLSGESTDYMVRLPTDDSQEIELDKLDAQIFTSLSQARDHMISRATEQIDLILERAKSISEVFAQFAVTEDADSALDMSISEAAVDEHDKEYAAIDLGDGKVGRIDVNDISKLKEMTP